jgi:RNA polymerase sigma-70 factor (ECF subfamily)
MTKSRKEKFEKVYAEYYGRLLNYVRRSSRNAEDIAQESFCRLWSAMSSGKKIKCPSGWVFLTATNLIRDESKAKSSKCLLFDSRLAFLLNRVNDDCHRDDTREGLLDDVIEALDKLSPQDKFIMVSKYIDRMPSKEIADIIGISLNSFHSCISRARKRLRGMFVKNYQIEE